MPAIKWSNSLASSAQEWADNLAYTDSLGHSSKGYGENLWAGASGFFSQTQMVEFWGSEQKHFRSDRVFPDTCQGGWNQCGHYTQIIWRKTTEVGCGLASNGRFDYFVCQYNPPGNVRGEKPY